jgi:hypothetical protein
MKRSIGIGLALFAVISVAPKVEAQDERTMRFNIWGGYTACGTEMVLRLEGRTNDPRVFAKVWLDGHADQPLLVTQDRNLVSFPTQTKIDCTKPMPVFVIHTEVLGKRRRHEIKPTSLKLGKNPANPPASFPDWYIASASASVACGDPAGVKTAMTLKRNNDQASKIIWSMKYGVDVAAQSSPGDPPESRESIKKGKTGAAIDCTTTGLKSVGFSVMTPQGSANQFSAAFEEVQYGSPPG